MRTRGTGEGNGTKVWSFCDNVITECPPSFQQVSIVSSRILTPTPWKIASPLNREPPPGDCNILNPPELRHLKFVEIPITTVLFLIKAWLTESPTHLLTQLMDYMREPLELFLKTTSQLFINYLPWANLSVHQQNIQRLLI